jgi:hypothetical protein
MRTAFAYTCARIIMFGASVMVLYWAGARGILLLGLALLISALLSYVLLNNQRQIIAGKLNGRLSRVGQKASELRERIDEGARLEDEGSADDVEEDATEPVTPASHLG